MQKQKALDLEKGWTKFPGGNFRLVPMRIGDLDEVMKVERACFHSPWTRWYFMQELRRNPLAHLFVLRHTGTKHALPLWNNNEHLVGFLVCWILNKELHINNIAVHPAWQGMGLGRSMTQFALEFGKQNGCNRAALEVRVSNQRAMRLYTSLGFHKIGEVRRYYEDGEDAWICARQLHV
jgi:[ribosomal protein S18]-alanine N-acetyltransferase